MNIRSLLKLLKMYENVIGLLLLLEWFPTLNSYDQPKYFLNTATAPFLDCFRNKYTMRFGVDLSGFIATTVLSGLIQILETTCK
jgi:YggT family protein